MKSPAGGGRRLAAQMAAASEKVENLIVVMCDTLDRHNMPKLANASEHCLTLADLWIKENLDTVREFFPKAEILSWEKDIRTHSSFKKYHETVCGLYTTSQRVKTLRDAMSNYYLLSKKKRHTADEKRGIFYTFDAQEAFQSSADYLDEEFAGDMVYHEMTGGLPHIYWGLYVDDYNIFSRESGLPLGFPKTLAVAAIQLSATEIRPEDLISAAFSRIEASQLTQSMEKESINRNASRAASSPSSRLTR